MSIRSLREPTPVLYSRIILAPDALIAAGSRRASKDHPATSSPATTPQRKARALRFCANRASGRAPLTLLTAAIYPNNLSESFNRVNYPSRLSESSIRVVSPQAPTPSQGPCGVSRELYDAGVRGPQHLFLTQISESALPAPARPTAAGGAWPSEPSESIRVVYPGRRSESSDASEPRAGPGGGAAPGRRRSASRSESRARPGAASRGRRVHAFRLL